MPQSFNDQIRRAKAVLRELKETLEDLDDRLELAKAIAENGSKALIPWEVVAKELGIPKPNSHKRTQRTQRMGKP